MADIVYGPPMSPNASNAALPTARSYLGAATATVLERAPTANDDAAHGYPTGSLWLDQEGKPWMSLRSTTGQAVWSQDFLDSSGNIQSFSGDALPGDIGTPIAIYGMRVVKNGYAGNLLSLIRLNDGTTTTIGSINNDLDKTTLDAWCAGTIARVTQWWDQSGNANHATGAAVVLQTNASNSATAVLNFASTASVNVGDWVDCDIPNVGGGVAYHVTAKTSTTVTIQTFDGYGSPALASGTHVMFGTAPRIGTPQNKIGASRAVVFDRHLDGRSSQQQFLTLPNGVTFAQNAFTAMFAARAEQTIKHRVFGLWTSGA